MSPDARKLASGTSWLLALQVTSYIFPLLLIPHLTRALGLEVFGVVAFGLALVQLASLVTDFGFSLSLTPRVARNKTDVCSINRLLGAAYLIKTALLVSISVLGALLIPTLENYREYLGFFALLIIPVWAQAFQPVWLFQGLEKMAFITIYTAFARGAHVILVLLFVHSPADINLIALSTGAAQALATLVSIGAVVRLGFRPERPSISEAWSLTRLSSPYFWSRAAVYTYTLGGTAFLGIFGTPTQAAVYSAAEQLYRGAQALTSPVSQALYPYMARTQNIQLFGKVLAGLCCASALGGAVGWLFAPQIVAIVFGDGFSAALPIVDVFILIFLITVPSVLLGYPFLGALGRACRANRSVIYAGLAQISFLFALWHFEVVGAIEVAFAVLAVEGFVLMYRARHAIAIKNQKKLSFA